MAMFKARATEDLAAIQAKLTDAKAAIPPLESELRALSLEAALSGDDGSVTDIQRRLREARERVELLELAAGEAEKRENLRLAAARSDLEKARERSIIQKLGAVTRAAEKWATAQEAAHATWLDLVQANGKAWATFSNEERTTSALFYNPDRLLQRCEIDLARAAWRRTKVDPHALVSEASPGVPKIAASLRHNVPAFAELCKSTAAYISDIFAGRATRPLTQAERDERTASQPKPAPASDIEIIAALNPGWRIVTPEEFGAAIKQRGRTERDNAAAVDALRTGRPNFHDIADDLDTTPAGRASLADKWRSLTATDTDGDENE